MAALLAALVFAAVVAISYLAWRRYLWASGRPADQRPDTCPYSLTDRFDENLFINVPHQKGARWLTDIFSRSAARYPDHPALQVPHTGETLTFAALNIEAERIAAALSRYLDGPDQVVAVAMPQDNWQIVASHLGILKAGGTLMFLDTTLPEALITHMLEDARPAVVLMRGEERFRDLPTLDVLALPQTVAPRAPPHWLDDPTQRLATIFYTSGTTGMPKGVECPHAGYVNLALTYADYFDLLPGMDATTLTSSLGYDGSISEMYSAWVSGCAVVLITKEQLRSGPDLVPLLRDAEVTVLFCPPVLLTTLTAEPEVDLPYPICRYVVPAGEAFPSVLVEPWTRARRQIVNTYGPTEASTDTSRQSLRPGEPITIGSPFPNVTYVILEVDGLTPLPHGEEGELCIGGVHLARGYRNLPEQTARTFIEHPEFGRLYRTGDRCLIDPATYRVQFFGRIDTQLKVRGHRVEAQAVEDILQSQFSEIEAAVLDYQNEALVAFVSAPGVADGAISVARPAPTAWAARVRDVLARQLPETSVPSLIYLVEKFVMKPVSGKIDRKCLPRIASLSASAERELENVGGSVAAGGNLPAPAISRAAPSDSEEPPESDEILDICRSVFEAPVRWDDAFADVGGHSIVIARLSQRLHQAGWIVPVRALLTDCNTARKIARRSRDARSAFEIVSIPEAPGVSAAPRDEAAAEVLPVARFTLLQVLFALFLNAPSLIAFLSVFGFLEIGTFFTTASVWAFIAVGVSVYVVGLSAPFIQLLWVMVVKLLLVGHVYRNNIAPGSYPKWSRMHLRIWCLGRLQATVLMPLGAMYRSAPLMAFALGQLGANVGRNLQCARDANFSGPLDLITIGDDVAIQTGAYIHTARWEGQNIHVGPVVLEGGCKIGMRAGVANNVTVGRDAWVTPFTPAVSDVGVGVLLDGSPPRASGRYQQIRRPQSACRPTLRPWQLETLNIGMQIGLFILLTVLPTAIILWAARQFIPLGEAELSGTAFTTLVATGADTQSATAGEGLSPTNHFMTAPLITILGQLSLYAFATTWLIIVVTSILASIFIRLTPAAPGIYHPSGLKCSLLMHRMSLLNGIQGLWTWTITGQYLRALAGLRFPRLGASECDVMFNLVPEVTSADSQIFWSNGSFTNVFDYGAGHAALRRIGMPRNFFSGNNCVAESGTLPDNFLLGVSTPCNDILFRRQMRTRTSAPVTVAGNPPLQFASASFEDENRSHRPPGFPLFLGRILLNDIFSIGVLRITEGLAFTLIYIVMTRYQIDAMLAAFLALVLAEAGLVALTVAVKQGLVGNTWGTDHKAPFWSWRHFSYFFAQDCFFAWCRGPLGFLAGTVLPNRILRLLGCQVGPRTIVIEPMQCSDWNAVRFGSDCVVGGFLQLHTFENMTLKIKETHFGDGTTVAFGATVMSGAVTAPNTTLQPLSMVLKEMNLPTGQYEGSPAQKVLP
ncbi:MAG: AMP-binding protein [Hyphomicrobiaceae bacterium]